MIDFLEKIKNFLYIIIEKLESQKINLLTWLISFFAIVFLKSFLDVFSSKQEILLPEFWEFFFFQVPIFYFSGILLLILIAYFLIKERIEKTSKIALFGAFLILLSPLLDLIFKTDGILIKYIDISILKISVGLGINLLVIGFLFLCYVHLKTKNIYKTISSLFLFCLLATGFVVSLQVFILYFKKFPSNLNSSFELSQILFSLFFILSIFLACFWFYIYNKEKFTVLLKNLRPLRALQNLAMLGFGLYLAGIRLWNLNSSDWLLVFMAAISLLLYWLSGIGYDDIYDREIDKISNPSRPLPQRKFSIEEFRVINHVLRIAAYILAFIVGYSFFLLIFLRSLLAYIYSFPPLRLKRFPIIATLTLALCALYTIFAGFLIDSSKSIFDFPTKLILFLLFAFTFGFMTKDIKDYQGDKAARVYTLPVIFGLEKGKLIIGILVLIFFLLTPFIFFDYFKLLILPSILAGMLSLFLISRKKYSEKPLFLIYFSYGLFFALSVF